MECDYSSDLWSMSPTIVFKCIDLSNGRILPKNPSIKQTNSLCNSLRDLVRVG